MTVKQITERTERDQVFADPDPVAAVGREAARDAWAEHAGDVTAIPPAPPLRLCALVAYEWGLIECPRLLTVREAAVATQAYRDELRSLGGRSRRT